MPILLLAPLLFACGLVGASEHREATFDFDGVVFIDRGAVESIPATAESLVIASIDASGRLVDVGDPIIVFDTQRRERILGYQRHHLQVAEANRGKALLDIDQQLRALHEHRDDLRRELAVLRAEIAREAAGDSREQALLAAQVERARQDFASGKRELALLRQQMDLGELAADDVADHELSLIDREQALLLAQLELERARAGDPFALAQLRLRERELLLEHEGVDGLGGTDQRLAVLESKLEHQRAKQQAALDEARRDLREAVRDVEDVTPLRAVEFLQGERVVRRVAFAPVGTDIPADWSLDHGAAFSESRGYGWEDDVGERIEARAGEGPRWSGVALIRHARWRCRLPPGRYRVRIAWGDDRDWHGAVLRLPDGQRFCRNELAEGEQLEHELTIGADGLCVLEIGDRYRKALRAPIPGVAKPQPWLYVGMKTRDRGHPLVYLSAPENFRIKARVVQSLLPLLRTGASADDAAALGEVDDPLERARARIASQTARISSAGGVEQSARVQAIDSTPVRLQRAPPPWHRGQEDRKDLIAREVTLVPERPGALRLGENVRCRVHVRPTDDMQLLPVHLVAKRGAETLVRRRDGTLQPVSGFRVGHSFLLVDGLDGSEVLRPVGDLSEDENPSDRRYPGEVIPGRRTEIGIARWWGKVQDLVPDGSKVEAGEVVVELYNPRVDKRRERVAEARVRARREYLLAAENRRTQMLDARERHGRERIAERRARLRLEALQEDDPLPVRRAALALQAAQRRAVHRADRAERMAALGDLAAGRMAAVQHQAELARLRARKAELTHVAALRRRDRLAILEARADWLGKTRALDQREAALRILRKREQVQRLRAEDRLQRAMRGGWRERIFEQIKNIVAPVSGRIFYRTGWNDATRSSGKIDKEFPVWAGLPIAEILDMSELGLQVELPEALYGELQVDEQVRVGLDQAPNLMLPGRVSEVGRSFYVPRELSEDAHGEQAVTMRRVFTVRVRFSPPEHLRDALVPGSKGYVELP